MLKNGLITLTLLFCLLPIAHAETYALLVGVGDYAMGDEEIDLPGIDKDISLMKGVARSLGIKPNNIQTFLDSQATKEQIVTALEAYARELKPVDSLLVYFSTHGIQVLDVNGDEQDGADEALAFYDLALKTKNGKDSLEGIITDDELGELLSKIPSHSKIVIIDSCHSGTMSKSFSLLAAETNEPIKQGKSLRFPQLPTPGYSKKNLGLTPNTEVSFDDLSASTNTIVLSAARDYEEAAPGEEGSLFTKSFSVAVNKTDTQTPYCWYRSVQRTVSLQSEGSQNPVLLGGFIHSNKLVGSSASNYIEAARAFSACDEEKHIRLKTPDQQLDLNTGLQVSVKSEQKGWFYLLAIQPDTIELFPWSGEGSATSATKINIGEQLLPDPVKTWEMDFDPGSLLVLGVRVKTNPQMEHFSWAKLVAGDTGEISTAILELNITEASGKNGN